ncbi:uncharacterized protein LOC123683803 isoform X2 [Harmonia axyridis]|uniref:uncharacterized protein LOC123683803 isoform X2 n=1 Tax=Harmonia axyridis TaxID=115357 RepID=UPI001E276D3B|nr:uncharacterized protein LOC123683803 isoform X2 [Harmonia axyridis]
MYGLDLSGLEIIYRNEQLMYFICKKDIEIDPKQLPNCQIQQLPEIICSTISQNKCIRVRGDMYRDFPYWSFGTFWSPHNEVMIGFLFVHPKVGTICFRDSDSTIGCIIVKNVSEDLMDIMNKPVYIEKYCIFSEIFNPNNKVNLEYLFLNFKDIYVLGKKRKRDECNVSNLKFQMTFHLLSKSYITYSSEKGFHFWVEVTNIKEYKSSVARCFLCLPEQLIEHWPLLEVSYTYTIKFAKELINIRDSEYIRVNPRLPQFFLRSDNSVELIPCRKYNQQEKLPFLNSETIPDILKTTGPVNFQAVLKFRKFNPNNSSRTMALNIPPVFGTIGEKTHILDFQVDGVKTLTLYLNNWERMATPVGLLPGVLVNVRNVMVQKTYCKSTALTSLEVVDYKPPCRFQTARLLTEDDWGTPYYFGGPNSIPNGVLVHCTVESYKVIKLFVKRSCVRCSYRSRMKGTSCVECNGDMETTCELLVTARDSMGPSKITINKLDMVKVFLGIENNFWSIWLDTFQLVGQYQFQRYGNYVNYALSAEQLKFVKMMNHVVKLGECKLRRKLHLLCRKLDNSRNHNKDEPLWYGLKVKEFS